MVQRSTYWDVHGQIDNGNSGGSKNVQTPITIKDVISLACMKDNQVQRMQKSHQQVPNTTLVE